MPAHCDVKSKRKQRQKYILRSIQHCQVIGKLELGGEGSEGSQLHHWTEIQVSDLFWRPQFFYLFCGLRFLSFFRCFHIHGLTSSIIEIPIGLIIEDEINENQIRFPHEDKSPNGTSSVTELR